MHGAGPLLMKLALCPFSFSGVQSQQSMVVLAHKGLGSRGIIRILLYRNPKPQTLNPKPSTLDPRP